MGVRESLAQQEPEEMRLQEMTIEARESEPVVFDPETEISDQDWQEMKQKLKDHRENNKWENFSWQAMEMKILAAKEVRIASQGIECIMPERQDFQEPKPELPVRKQF